ncbi:maestro heat-like repeat-containing protein family member 7 isoform X3 [Phalacrocorax carbo]|uniref:maestro heat-like repeat-containing protein family member 7 isoform X3 n=1 Tax=Phalacrocorax carbo TaxID=9209 RepID=UPI0031193A5B
MTSVRTAWHQLKHQCVISIILILNAKRSTVPAPVKEINSLPAKTVTPWQGKHAEGPEAAARTSAGVARDSPRRSSAPRGAEEERAGVAAEDQQHSESPRQHELPSEDLGSASPPPNAEEEEEEEEKSPSQETPSTSAAATAPSCQLEGDEEEAHDYFLAFLNSTERVTAAFGGKALPAAPSWALPYSSAACARALGGLLPVQSCSPPGPLHHHCSASSPCSCWPCLCPLTLPPSLSLSFLPDCQEEASKLRVLASICTLCRAWLQGRYLPSFRAACELVEKMEVLRLKEFPPSMDAAIRQQAVLVIAAVSKNTQGLRDQPVCHCASGSFHLLSAENTEHDRDSLDAQILKTLDSMLMVLMHRASPRTTTMIVEKLLQALVPFTASQDVATRRSAVRRIVSLSRCMRPASMLEASRFTAGTTLLFKLRTLPFLGQVMGHLTLSCAEQDQEISRGAVEALRAFHRFILLRHSSKAAWEDPNLPAERESATTLGPKESADEAAIFGNFLFQTERTDFILTVLKGMVHPRVSDTQPIANMLEVVLRDPSSELAKVGEVVQTIHGQLAYVSQQPLKDILRRTLLRLAQLYPWEVTTGLLHASPHCDSTARAMWSMLASDRFLAETVLKQLLLAQEEGASLHVFEAECCCCCCFLAVAGAMSEIFQEPACRCRVLFLLAELFMAVVVQISFSLKSSRQGCCRPGSHSWEANHPTDLCLRHALSGMQGLFQCLGGASLLEDIGRQGAWDMLMSPETYHTGIALLTRVLRREVPDCCASIWERAAVGLLQRQDYLDVGAMTVFVELLDCTDFEDVSDHVLYVVHIHLRSKNLVLRRMAVTSLVTLSGRPEQAATLQYLLPRVSQQLRDDDCEVRTAALTVLSNVLCLVDRQTALTIALQLVEMLLPLFENESSYVRKHSILLCRDAMKVAVRTHKKQLRKDVQRSLVPLFFHLHDSDHSVAQLTQNSRRAEEYLHQSLPYLQSPQEALREAAIRFLGLAGQQLRDGCQEKLQVIYEALQGTVNDRSLSVASLASQTLLILGAAAPEPPSGFRLQALCYRLRRAWRRRKRTPALGAGCLCCWNWVQR